MSAEREYVVTSTYKVTGTAYVMAHSAAEAIEKASDLTADEPVQFYFGEAHSETKMRARKLAPMSTLADASEGCAGKAKPRACDRPSEEDYRDGSGVLTHIVPPPDLPPTGRGNVA